MMNEGVYHSIFVTQAERSKSEILAWAAAYAAFLRDAPERPGWCQKKADDEWQKWLEIPDSTPSGS